METLQDATEKICDLKGTAMAMQCALLALFKALPHDAATAVATELSAEHEACTTVLQNALVSEHTVQALERDMKALSNALSRD